MLFPSLQTPTRVLGKLSVPEALLTYLLEPWMSVNSAKCTTVAGLLCALLWEEHQWVNYELQKQSLNLSYQSNHSLCKKMPSQESVLVNKLEKGVDYKEIAGSKSFSSCFDVILAQNSSRSLRPWMSDAD